MDPRDREHLDREQREVERFAPPIAGQWPKDLAERIVDEIGRSGGVQWASGANLSRAAAIIRKYLPGIEAT